MRRSVYIGKQCIYKGVALTLQLGTGDACEGCYVNENDPDNYICDLIDIQRGQRDCSDIHNAIWVKSPDKPSIAQSLSRAQLVGELRKFYKD